MRISVRAFCSKGEQNTHRDKDWIHETPGSVLHSVGMKCLDPSASRRERRTSIPVSQDSVFLTPLYQVCSVEHVPRLRMARCAPERVPARSVSSL